MKSVQKDIDERTNLTSSNKFELLLFRLGTDGALGQSELFGINVFKIREIVAMPAITPIVGATAHSLGVVNLTDEDPPLAQFALGYDPVVADPRGRVFSLGLTKRF